MLANADFGHISPLATLPRGGRAVLIIGDAPHGASATGKAPGYAASVTAR